MSSSSLESNLQKVRDRITQCVETNNRPEESVRIIAVSKYKHVDMIKQAYQAGQRYFGENYAQELISKHQQLMSITDQEDDYSDIRWHFIGSLQSNKAASLISSIGLHQLACVETVSTIKLATKLDNASGKWIQKHTVDNNENTLKLRIYIQINTSGEETKSGLRTIDKLSELVTHIMRECPNLKIQGLMTIGITGDISCFGVLEVFRNVVAKILSVSNDSLELSMGMSNDFEEAINHGATNVRIGSTIFGKREN